MAENDPTLAEIMDAHRIPSEMDAAMARIRERMFASQTVAGRAVGRYVLIDAIGEGGMGSVMRAYDPRLQREVALKRLRSARNAAYRGRLLREARAMAKLRHPNVVSVHDVELIDDELVVAMEYVRGVDLHAWLKESRTADEILNAFVQAGRGLGAAHAEGLVHRDFKPANALVDEAGRVQVTDFGLVRDANEDAPSTPAVGMTAHPALDELQMDRTAADTALGTPRYMAPEQERGGEIDRRADIYAFCVALWEALAGISPFTEMSLEELQTAKLKAKPQWPRGVSIRRGVLRALERGMQPNPADRWSTMAALLSAIEPSTRARHHWWLALPIAAAIVPAVMVSTSGSDAICDADSGPPWSAQRTAVEQRLTNGEGAFAEDVAARAVAKLDTFVEGWESRRDQACEAKIDPADRELALACLKVGRARLDNIAEVLETVNPDEVRNVHRLLGELPDLSRCSDRESSLAREALDSPEARETRRLIAAARDLYVLGRSAENLEAAQAALEAAKFEGLESLEIEARLGVGAAYIQQARYDEATDWLRESLSIALRQGEDGLAARAASILGSILASRGSSTAEGVALTRLALDLTSRTRDDAWAPAVHTNASFAFNSAGHPAEAIEIGRKALKLSLDEGLGETPQHVQRFEVVAVPLCKSGRYDEGLAFADDAVALARRLVGPRHPYLAGPLGTRGVCLASAGDADAAIEDYRAALAIFEDAYGPDDERVGVILDNLGLALAQNGDPFEAETLMRRSLAIKTRLYKAGHLQITFAQEGLAYALKFQGRLDEAEALFVASLQTRRANLEEHTLPVVHGLLGLAILAIDRGHVDAGAALLDQTEDAARVAVAKDSSVFDTLQEQRDRLW